MSRLLAIGGAITTAIAGAVGTVYMERNSYIADTVSEAEKIAKSTASECARIEAEIAQLRQQEASQQLALQDKMSTVEALWDERDRRVYSETKRAADAIFATPEAYSVLSGISAHCNDSAQKFPYFYEEFDLNASKVHTIDMLLNSVLCKSAACARRANDFLAGVPKAGFTMRDIAPALGMFRSDPFVSSLSLLLRADMKLHGYDPAIAAAAAAATSRNEQDGAASSSSPSLFFAARQDLIPSSVGELSKTFGTLMQHFQLVCVGSFELQQQIKRDAKLRNEKQQHEIHRENEVKLATQNNNINNNDSTTSSSTAAVAPNVLELGFMVERVVPRVADAAHLVTTAEADYLEIERARELQRRKDIATSWNLYDTQDVFAAIDYITRTHDKVVTAASEGNKWALDTRVAPAMKNLLVWSVAAEQYLAEEQTRNVLRDMTRCMSHSFVQINPIPGKNEQEN